MSRRLALTAALAAVVAIAAASPGWRTQAGPVEPAPPSEIVHVKYAADEVLDGMDCRLGALGSFVERSCYDIFRHRLIVRLRGTYYAYCAVPSDVVRGLREAAAPGRYYDDHIKAPSPFDCRLDPLATAALPAVALPHPHHVATRSGMTCGDGSTSHAKHRRGACSHHGGLR